MKVGDVIPVNYLKGNLTAVLGDHHESTRAAESLHAVIVTVLPVDEAPPKVMEDSSYPPWLSSIAAKVGALHFHPQLPIPT